VGYDFRFDLILKYSSFLLEGLKNTVLISLLGLIIGLVIGLLIAILRLTKNRWLDYFLSFYVDFFRSIPQLAILFWFFYAIPLMTGYQVSALLSAAIALGILSSATLSEIFRGGILSLGSGQWEAASALGMTLLQAYRRIVLPQAIVRMLPPFSNMTISIVKASALASAVGVVDLMWQGNALMVYTNRRVEVFTVVAVMYFVLTYPQAILVNRVYKRLLKVD